LTKEEVRGRGRKALKRLQVQQGVQNLRTTLFDPRTGKKISRVKELKRESSGGHILDFHAIDVCVELFQIAREFGDTAEKIVQMLDNCGPGNQVGHHEKALRSNRLA
jgi:hypothetical protein